MICFNAGRYLKQLAIEVALFRMTKIRRTKKVPEWIVVIVNHFLSTALVLNLYEPYILGDFLRTL